LVAIWIPSLDAVPISANESGAQTRAKEFNDDPGRRAGRRAVVPCDCNRRFPAGELPLGRSLSQV
jgi:hypothetical protein